MSTQMRHKKEDSKVQATLCLPLVDNLLKDNTDGCSLAALLHFYCPSAVPLEGTAAQTLTETSTNQPFPGHLVVHGVLSSCPKTMMLI